MLALRLLLVVTILSLALSCNSGQKTEAPVATKDTLAVTNSKEKQTFEMLLDSVYNNKNYKIVQEHYSDGIGKDSSNSNTVFTFFKLDDKTVLIKDTVYSLTGDIEFRDFNGDNVKDILIQSASDVRSNWTYNLYILDTTKDKLTKIKGFNKIKNPNYLPQHDLIDNSVISGRNWTSFYKIQGDSVKDFDFVIYEDLNDEGNYEKEYKKAIARIIKNNHNR
jgi:hypothetical protein